jgi:hypothetical protein
MWVKHFDFAPVTVIALPEPDVDVVLSWDEATPEFTAGSTHRASLLVSNPTELPWTYRVELLFAAVLERRWVSIVIPPGGQTMLEKDIVMPSEPGQYAVEVDVYVD